MIRLFATIAFLITSAPAWATVDIQEVTSAKGIKAWLVQDNSIPFAAIELRFRGGTSTDPEGARGAVYLMSALLEEGAGDRDARTFARDLESLAASFGFDASDDSVSVSARFLTENRDEAIALLREAIHQPRFDPDAIERVRQQVLSGLRSDANNPNDIAAQAFSELAFGDHPYGSEGKGTVDSVATLTRDDLIAAHAGVFAKDRLYVGAVGDITPEDLGVLLDTLLGDLADTGAEIPPEYDVDIEGGVTVVDYDTPQSVAIFGHEGIERDDPDFFAAFVLNQILGAGGFESRLTKEVRVKRGLTYGVYSYLASKDLAPLYLGSVSSANSRIAEAIEVIGDEWTKASEQGVTEEELQAAKTFLTGAYPLRFDGNGRIASILVGMQMEDLPIDYIATRNDKVNAVTLEEVNRVAAKLLSPDDLHFIVVGKPEGLEQVVTD